MGLCQLIKKYFSILKSRMAASGMHHLNNSLSLPCFSFCFVSLLTLLQTVQEPCPVGIISRPSLCIIAFFLHQGTHYNLCVVPPSYLYFSVHDFVYLLFFIHEIVNPLNTGVISDSFQYSSL